MGLIKAFREFALKGNFIDMAMGIVVGMASAGVVNSLVKDLITPIISIFTGGINFSHLSTPLRKGAEEEGADLLLTWGNFLQTFINFLILMFVVFLIVKAVNVAKSRFVAQSQQPTTPPDDIRLLTEIRDALRSR